MAKIHLWENRWIDDAELEREVARLPEWLMKTGEDPLDLEALLRAAQAYSSALKLKRENYGALLESLTTGEGLSKDEAEAMLSEMASFLDPKRLEEKLCRELGSTQPFQLVRKSYLESVFEAWAPLGLLVHVAPSNSPTVAPASVIEGLLSGNVCFLKTSGGESLFPQLFLHGLLNEDSTGKLARYVVAAKISSRNRGLLERVFHVADGVAAWGGEEAIEALRKMTPPSARFIEWGHKLSFVYLTEEASRDEKILENAARECCWLEQQACSSPQCVYLETESYDRLTEFAQAFSRALDRVSQTIPLLSPPPDAQAEITLVTELAREEACLGGAYVHEGKRGDWRVLVDKRPALNASPLFRTVWIRPLPREQIVAILHPMRYYLQTVGLSCSLGDVADLSRRLLAAGAARIRRVGEMGGSYEGEPHDGVYALQRYTRRVSVQLGEEARGISDLSDLKIADSLRWKKCPSILTKAEFQKTPVDERYAELYFKSGGSTGEPMLSVFTYDDYHEQMRAAAEGLYAAGLDPLTDRNMNLFFGGSLYGGFLSVFTVLEHLRAVHFPMGAVQDYDLVIDAIIKNRVSVLLGMPSYLMQLFTHGEKRLESYGKVEKIFYGGEHFHDAQQRLLRERFGVSAIKSIGYSSVDTGPLGFQCRFCSGGEHHLHQKLQYLEIVDLEKDVPSAQECVGRLIFTSRKRSGQNILRYDLGDVGHWVEGPCKCGRRSPRFRLLGRSGDVFRIATCFLNYKKIVQILVDRLAYGGAVQVCLSQGERKEKLTVRITSEGGKAPSLAATMLLDEYDDLREVAVEEKLLDFEVVAIANEAFERSKSSGKIRSVVDLRGAIRGK